MKPLWNTTSIPAQPLRTSHPHARATWVLACLLSASVALLASPMGEAARSPLSFVPAFSASAGPLESALSDLIRLTRERRVLVAASDANAAAGDLARLDALLRQSLGALRHQSDSLPASIALDISALSNGWHMLESAHPGPQSTPSASFDQHSRFIDSQLVLLSHVRSAGL